MDEMSDNPMSPEQIQALLDRQIALTRELDLDNDPGAPLDSVGSVHSSATIAPARTG